MDGRKVRFSLEATETGGLCAFAIDVAIPAVSGKDLVELRSRVAAAVEVHFGRARPVALLVGARPRRLGPVRAPRRSETEAAPTLAESHAGSSAA